MSVAGIDGCRNAWLCIELDGDAWRADVHQTIASAWDSLENPELVLIDIPIGLWDSGTRPRLCDAAVRRLLGPRRSSVFTPPLRSALAFDDYAGASLHNYRLSGRKLSRQAWGIAPKIDEADRFLAETHQARGVLREAHPELSLMCLNGRLLSSNGLLGSTGNAPMRHPKKTPAGIKERRRLLTRFFPATAKLVRRLRREHARSAVADDDIYDALANALAARFCLRAGTATLPEVPEHDARGLPMEVVYPEAARPS